MIKLDIEMPRSCSGCFALVEDELHGYVFCKLTKQTIKYSEFVKLQGTSKMDKCPLQEDTSVLKPCPFCGSTVEIKKTPMWREDDFGKTIHGYRDCYTLKISCPKCGCSTARTDIDTVNITEEQAKNYIVKNWNMRYNK